MRQGIYRAVSLCAVVGLLLVLGLGPALPAHGAEPAARPAAPTERTLANSVPEEQADVDWRERTPPVRPSARYWHSIAYDSLRGVAVLFGGNGVGGIHLDDTWEWDGSAWSQRSPTAHPSGRDSHAMAYDSQRGVVVLFGGWDGNRLDDTWEWDGTDWLPRYPATHPPARDGHAMVYDSVRGVTVLFGGMGNSGRLGDTWEWNGTAWSERSLADHPSARWWPAMVYDATRSVAVLFGGWPDSGDGDQTWEWDGVMWLLRDPSNHPPARWSHAMAYDTARSVTVLFGGWSHSEYDDTWEWNGTDWEHRSPVNHPQGQDGHALAYDSSHDVVVLFGGWNGARLDRQWEYGAPLPAPALQPIPNADGDNDFPVDWSDVPGASQYTLQEDDSASFSSPTTLYEGAASQRSVTAHPGGSWFFRVRASNADGNSPWSNTQSAGVRPLPPALSPISNADGDGDYTVDWAKAAGADSYQLQEDDDNAFPSPTTRYTGANTDYPVSAQPDGTYYYRVRASNPWGTGLWSQTRPATVGSPPATFLPAVIYLPFVDPYEPNDSFFEAWGPLASGQTYQAYFPGEQDNADYYHFTLPAAHSVEVWLTGIPPGNDYDLYLYDALPAFLDFSGTVGSGDEHIFQANLPAGKYYLRLTREQGTSRTQPYALRVVFQ